MRFKTLTCAALLVGFLSTSASAASLLGPLLDNGPFDGVEDFVATSANGTVTLGAAGTLTFGDTIVGVLPFTTVGPDATTQGPLGPGFGAIVFSGTFGTPTVIAAGLTSAPLTATGDLPTLLSSVPGIGGGSGNEFAALLTSSTVDFTAGLPTINSAAVTLEAMFDLSPASSTVLASTLSPGDFLDFTNSFNLVVEAATVQAGLNFIPVPTGSPTGDLIGSLDSTIGFLTVVGGQTGTGPLPLGGAQLAQLNPLPEPTSILAVLGCVACGGLLERRRRKTKKA